MKQLKEYTKEDFNKDYYHYCFNNNFFTDAALISESKVFSTKNNKDYFHIGNMKYKVAVEKLGKENFISDWDSYYWIFEFNDNIFYYQNNEYKGSTIGIFCKKKDLTKNWFIEPEDFFYKKDTKLGQKLLDFCKELSGKLKN